MHAPKSLWQALSLARYAANVLQMKAWAFEEEGDGVQLKDVPEPQLCSGAAIIDVLACHVRAYTGALTTGARGMLDTPLTLGAGCVGRVASAATDVFNVTAGDVVLSTALLSSGDAAEPEELIVGWTGIGGRGVATERTAQMRRVWHDGVWSERALVPKELLLRLPGADLQHHSAAQLAFLPWLAIAAAGLERAGLVAGHTVAIVGATGQLGGAAVLVALAYGAARVVAVGRNESALSRLRRIDARVATAALSGDRAAMSKAIMQAAGQRVDVVLDSLGATPTADATLAGFDSVGVDGAMCLIGGVRQSLVLTYGDIMRRRLKLCGSWMATHETTLRMWRLVQGGVIDLSAVSVATVGIDDPSAAVQKAAATKGLSVVVLTI